jgi:hypothetical protein
MGAVAIGAILIAALLLVAAATVWQESRHASEGGTPLYLLDEASRYVHERLSAAAAGRLSPGDVTTILEWGMYHKQVIIGREGSGVPVVGGEVEIAYVAARAAKEGGSAFHESDVEEVLALEAGYLIEIGAVGEPVEEDPR